MNGRQVGEDGEARFGGVDWSWERHAVCVVDAAGVVIERFEAEHQAAGLRRWCGGCAGPQCCG